jgi:hypothetical protein
MDLNLNRDEAERFENILPSDPIKDSNLDHATALTIVAHEALPVAQEKNDATTIRLVRVAPMTVIQTHSLENKNAVNTRPSAEVLSSRLLCHGGLHRLKYLVDDLDLYAHVSGIIDTELRALLERSPEEILQELKWAKQALRERKQVKILCRVAFLTKHCMRCGCS